MNNYEKLKEILEIKIKDFNNVEYLLDNIESLVRNDKQLLDYFIDCVYKGVKYIQKSRD